MEEDESYFCLECGNEQDSMRRPCDNCGSGRVHSYHVWGMNTALKESVSALDESGRISLLREAIGHAALEFERLAKKEQS